MKKIFAVLFALSVISSASAEKLIITYDFNNRMQSVELYSPDKTYTLDAGSTAFIYDPFANTREEFFQNPEPQPEEIPEEKFPSIYKKQVYANNTFAIVTDVYETAVDDERAFAVEVLFQGKETVFYINDSILIGNAPQLYSSLAGQNASALQAGDIINITAYFSGAIREVNLIARMGTEEIITSPTDWGRNFENLCGTGGYIKRGDAQYPISNYGNPVSGEIKYQFGLIYYADDNYYLLTNKDGRSAEFETVEFLPETIVYRCDMSRKAAPKLSDVSAIRSSFILPENIDDDENINAWDSIGTYIYAFSRTVDDIATDIVIFENFK